MQQTAAVPGLMFPYAQPPGPGELVAIADGIRWFRLPLPYRLDHVNIYLIQDDDGWTVLDTGLGTDACRTTWGSILAGPLAGQRLTSMVVTHFHPDHVGLAGWLAKRFDLPLRCRDPNIFTAWRCNMRRAISARTCIGLSIGVMGFHLR